MLFRKSSTPSQSTKEIIMSEFTIGAVLPKDLNKLVEHLMKAMDIKDPNKAIQCINHGEWTVIPPATPRWHDKKDRIIFNVTSDGTTSEEWLLRLKRKGFVFSDWAEECVRSNLFKPSNGVTYRVEILKHRSCFCGERSFYKATDNLREQEIQETAKSRGLSVPNLEVALLVREYLSDIDMKSMKFCGIVVMSEIIQEPNRVPYHLEVLQSYCQGISSGLTTHNIFNYIGDIGLAFVRNNT